MGESPFCATAHIDMFGEAGVLYGVMVACNEVVFTFLDNAGLNILSQRRI